MISRDYKYIFRDHRTKLKQSINHDFYGPSFLDNSLLFLPCPINKRHEAEPTMNLKLRAVIILLIFVKEHISRSANAI